MMAFFQILGNNAVKKMNFFFRIFLKKKSIIFAALLKSKFQVACQPTKSTQQKGANCYLEIAFLAITCLMTCYPVIYGQRGNL